MGQRSALGSLLFFLGLHGIFAGLELDNCTNYRLQFERVFSVPGDGAMLNSTLVSPDVYNFTATPYNITWYDSKTGREISDQPGRIMVRGETLWFLNITLDDDGEYEAVVRTPYWCYRQSTKLVVEERVPGTCERPRKAHQTLTHGVTDSLHCPLKDYISKLNSYNVTTSITWYQGCEPIKNGGKFTYLGTARLLIDRVEHKDNSAYTCALTFALGGVTVFVSETIDAYISDTYSLAPRLHEPANEIIKEHLGSNFSKRCLVFVPCVGGHGVDIFWIGNEFITSTDPSDRVYTSQRSWKEDGPVKGEWMELVLRISELREEDFMNYTCQTYSDRGHPRGYFSLQPADPNILLPIGCVLSAVTVLFITSVVIYYIFKVDIVLWFRRAFPVLYTNTDLDGKLYDAYVAYPQPCAAGFTEEVEAFALHTLPKVLEKACGYKLFIAGRDCTPGRAIMDSVEENMQASRRLLLLYTASTFISKRHTSSIRSNNNNNNSNNNNNTSKSSDSMSRDSSSCMSSDSSDEYSDTRQQLECVAAMHRALLEGTLKVILVELEEITPAQLALFPESVRHLRKKQGAVCWWKNRSTRRRWRTCTRTGRDEEKAGGDADTQPSPSPSLSPDSRFWKKMRYYMPVRGKRAAYPEKTALLHL